MAITKQYIKKDGTKAWMFQAYLGVDPITGKEKRTTRRGFKTEKEANLALARLQLDIDKNGFQSEYKVKTFQDLYNAWIEQYKHTIKPTTYESISRIFKHHILPKLGPLKLKKINHVVCQKVLNEWAEKYKSFKVFKINAKMVFKYGVRIGICDSNPFDKVIMPKKGLEESAPNAKDSFYTKMELKLLFECLEQMNNMKWLAFFRVLSFTGARKGEVLALNWEDIDFDNQIISFNKTLVVVNNTLTIQSPKTKTSNRIVSVDHETLAIMKKWQIKQKEMRLSLGIRAASEDIIFNRFTPSLESNYLYLDHPNKKLNAIYKRFPELKKIKIHGFRHTHASLLFESGADIKIVQKRLGHSDIKTTMDIYTHVSPEHEKDSDLRFVKYVNF